MKCFNPWSITIGIIGIIMSIVLTINNWNITKGPSQFDFASNDNSFQVSQIKSPFVNNTLIESLPSCRYDDFIAYNTISNTSRCRNENDIKEKLININDNCKSKSKKHSYIRFTNITKSEDLNCLRILFSDVAKKMLPLKWYENYHDTLVLKSIKGELIKGLNLLLDDVKIYENCLLLHNNLSINFIVKDLCQILYKSNEKIHLVGTADKCRWRTEDRVNKREVFAKSVKALFNILEAVNKCNDHKLNAQGIY